MSFSGHREATLHLTVARWGVLKETTQLSFILNARQQLLLLLQQLEEYLTFLELVKLRLTHPDLFIWLRANQPVVLLAHVDHFLVVEVCL